MKWRALLRDRKVRWLAGIGIGWSVLVYVLASGGAPADAATSDKDWLLIEGDPVLLERGVRYRGCVETPFVVPNNIVRGKLRPALEARGFRDIAIAETRPGGWPDVDCDFFVECTWDRDDEELERPGAVAFAWRRRADA
jgi:hypothetical protein